MRQSPNPLVQLLKFVVLLRSWIFAFVLLGFGIAYIVLGHVAGRLVGAAMILGFLVLVWSLAGGSFVRRRL